MAVCIGGLKVVEVPILGLMVSRGGTRTPFLYLLTLAQVPKYRLIRHVEFPQFIAYLSILCYICSNVCSNVLVMKGITCHLEE